MADDDPLIDLPAFVRKSQMQLLYDAAKAHGVTRAVVLRWILDHDRAYLLSLITPTTNGARNDADHPGG
jgi:hypothetical protein